MKSKGILYLIPNILHEHNDGSVMPGYVREKVKHIRHFIFESEKAGRALVKKLQIDTPQNELQIALWNEHSDKSKSESLLVPLLEGYDTGLASDAGIPCVADPGYEIVYAAHRHGIRVVPLPGSSSIFMALMASGLGGQSFAFHGYLPIEKPQRVKKIKDMEEASKRFGQTQVFMEAPYRNNALFEELLRTANAATRIGIAVNLVSDEELVATRTVAEWKKTTLPDLHKKPCVFTLR